MFGNRELFGGYARRAVFNFLLDHVAEKREPDVYIGGKENPNVVRWHLVGQSWLTSFVGNVYLHEFCRSDTDRALHDHPYLFNASWLLAGDYTEHTFSSKPLKRAALPSTQAVVRERGDFVFRWGGAPHRIVLDERLSGPAHVWTLFFTGPRVREWGFWCPKGWRPWHEFVTRSASEAVETEGCGED